MKFDKKDVSLRPLTEQDAFTSFRWRNNAAIWTYTVRRPDKEITIEDELNWIRKVINEMDSKRFAIIVHDVYIGNVQLTEMKNGECYYGGIFIGDQEYWGKGIGEITSILILKYAFEQLSMKIVKGRVKTDHDKAIHLYEKIGFKRDYTENEILHIYITPEDLIDNSK